MKRSHQFWLSSLFCSFGITTYVGADTYDVPDDFPTIQAAINAAALNEGPDTVTIGPGVMVSGPITVGWQFNEANSLVLRPREGQRRATIVSWNGAAPAITVTARSVLLQDLDVLRQATTRTNLINLLNCYDVTVERCRFGSVKPQVYPENQNISSAVVNILNPEEVILRNCICFAVAQGTFDFGIRSTVATFQKSLILYNNNVANHRAAGLILMDRFAGSRYLLRNNVVVNPMIAQEPFAYASQLPMGSTVISSHNTALASPGRVEFLAMNAQPISGPGPFARLRFMPAMAPLAFETMVWITNPLDHPNEDFYRLVDGGILHNANPLVRGVTVGLGVPSPLDLGVFDDWEGDLRPAGHPAHTDRGADQVEPPPPTLRVPIRDLWPLPEPPLAGLLP